ncbi:methionine--tRNA ligase, mitochondrial-like isoform X3 [Ostrinia furnacalis]|uniref:methionine--tRNA ligase, mitochondrial-like isoform X3 n=1 Tax=Ostrinia furnacalis TaxID=93504 RepID=UPI00103ED4EC|nr:methionine--tRNA ligase, mitochondrial-like isoform X3 [Ostrinia furnacalis]
MRLNIRLLSSAVQKRPFYVTTPIFYVNAAPHLGHLYSAVVADAIQRFEKLTNPDCNIIFSTGTDEHGTKIQQAAAKAKLPLPEYCSKTSDEYRTLFKEFNVDFTDYVRTTEKRHKVAVKHFWNKLMKKDYIYKAKYSGWYSVNDESFVPEAHTREDIVNGEKVKVSVESGHRVEWTEETNYMFRLSAFKTHLKEWLSTDGVITPSKFQKQLQELLENEVYFPDISVSRPSSRVHWAIRVPNDEEQSIYVWLDALINYLTAIGYPDEDAMIRRGRPWPADVHVVGKDILKFHGIYWPAFLMATSWPPPRRLVCHSHWTVDGSKMSKSLGNVVDPRRTPVNPSALRYLLLREATMAGDANYSETKLINVANSELADTLGNLASRCCGASLNPRQEFPPLHVHELATCRQVDVTANLLDRVERLPEICHEHYSNYQFYKAVDAVIHTLHLANLFFETHKPWELRKQVENQKHLDVILHITMETLRICGIILQPIIPDMSQKLLDKLQIPKDFRNWQHCERPSWSIEDAIYETKYIQNGKFVLFQRVYVDKNNVQKKKAKA